jgi:hypothetical protein
LHCPSVAPAATADPAFRQASTYEQDHVAHNIRNVKHPDGTKMQAHELMPAVHRASALKKRWILGTHQGAVSKELLDYYLAEFAFRYNRRYSRHRGLLFYRLAEQTMATEPKPYVELLAAPGEQTPQAEGEGSAEQAHHWSRRQACECSASAAEAPRREGNATCGQRDGKTPVRREGQTRSLGLRHCFHLREESAALLHVEIGKHSADPL